MKPTAVIIKLLGIFFIVLGITWFACIAIRCEEISPGSVFPRFVSSASSITSNAQATSLAAREPEKFRSLQAKPYHDLFFWSIQMLEIYVAIFYVLAGVFLLMRYVLARAIGVLTLSLDVLLKVLVIGYMKFGAIPLSQLTHNPNLLQIYFMPSDKLHSSFSSIVSGLQLYSPMGVLYLVSEIAYFGLCFYLVFHKEDA